MAADYSSFDYYMNKGTINGLDVTMMHPDVKEKIISLTPKLPEDARMSERIYWLKNGITDYKKCKTCGKDITKFINGTVGYKDFCSKSCSKYDIDYKERAKKKCLKLHGVEHTAKLESTKEKRKSTNLEKYGDEFPNRWGSDNFREAMVAVHGVDSVMKHPEYNKQITEANKQKYVEYKLQNRLDAIYAKNKIKLLEDYKGHNYKHKWIHEDCNTEFYSNMINGKLPHCPICNASRSQAERDVADFISSLGFTIISNDITLIYPLELDIVVPDKKIAIEYNGIYWHSSKFKNKYYHINKTKAVIEKGYELIHIDQYEWLDNQEIVKNILRHKLGCNTSARVFARKCVISEINNQEYKEFLNKHHIQGYGSASFKIGLKYNNELVAVMSFGKSRFNKEYKWEMIRYASKGSVIGGAGKLLKYFRNQYPNDSIISYCDLKYNNGNMYKKLGFKLSHISEPSFKYTDGINTVSRFYLIRHNLTHVKMMEDGWEIMYDCGNAVYVL